MSVARVFFTGVHEHVVRLGVLAIEDQVDLDAAGVDENRHRLRTDRPNNKLKAQGFVATRIPRWATPVMRDLLAMLAPLSAS